MANLRTGPRFPANQPAEVRKVSSPGIIVDFSESGLRLRLAFAVLRGSTLEVEWDLGIATGEVRYCRRTGPSSYSVGLKVDKLVEKRPVHQSRMACMRSQLSL